jgi:hypothetical protein
VKLSGVDRYGAIPIVIEGWISSSRMTMCGYVYLDWLVECSIEIVTVEMKERRRDFSAKSR